MSRPVLIDLFCGAGGAAVGYHAAGFEIVGVDIQDQPNYPYEFIKADALEAIKLIGRFADAIHASPPCQHYTTLARGNNGNRGDHPDLIPPIRTLLEKTGKPYIIENVPTAPLIDPITLCGEMFGLGVIRHRIFESNRPLVAPAHVPHRGRVAGWRHGVKYEGVYCAVYGNGGGKGTLEDWRQAMGMPWAQTKLEIAEAIPPAYAEHLGGQLLDALAVAA